MTEPWKDYSREDFLRDRARRERELLGLAMTFQDAAQALAQHPDALRFGAAIRHLLDEAERYRRQA